MFVSYTTSGHNSNNNTKDNTKNSDPNPNEIKSNNNRKQ